MTQEIKEISLTGKAIIAVVLIPTIVALNYVGGVMVKALKAPIWGDTWATILVYIFFDLILNSIFLCAQP